MRFCNPRRKGSPRVTSRYSKAITSALLRRKLAMKPVARAAALEMASVMSATTPIRNLQPDRRRHDFFDQVAGQFPGHHYAVSGGAADRIARACGGAGGFNSKS